ncbi:hypothetical protein KQI84_01245 [bacterium]|nr:hypothetical protein [bacterium]
MADMPICYNCLAENEPDRDMCWKCNAPLTAYATIDPIKRIHAGGFFLSRLVARRPSLPVLLLAWCSFGGFALGHLCAAGMTIIGTRISNFGELLIIGASCLFFLFWAVLILAIPIRMTVAYRRSPASNEGTGQKA